MKTNRTIWTLVVALSGLGTACLDTPVETEGGSATVSVGGKSVYLSFWARGWPGGNEARGQVEVTHDDSAGWCLGKGGDGTQVDIDGDRIAMPDMWPTTDSRSRDSRFINRIELEADTTGLFGGWGTDLAIAMFWRRAGSRDYWKPVNCGIMSSSDRLRDTDVEYYDPDLVAIDYNRWTITATSPTGNSTQSRSFESCGIGDSSPEFAAYVFPRWNSCNMEDQYEYKIKASCDNRDCPRYVGDPTSGGSSSSSRYGSDTYNRNGSSNYGNKDPRRSDSYTGGSSNWTVQGRSFTIRDDTWSCDSVQMSTSGYASDVRLSVSGTHTYPEGLDFELWHGQTVVVDSYSLPSTSGRFTLNDVRVTGLDQDIRGEWELCVGDPTDDYDTGRVDSWSVRAYR